MLKSYGVTTAKLYVLYCGGLQYRGGYHDTCEGYHQYRGGYHLFLSEYRGGYHDTCQGDIIVLNITHSTQDIPHGTHDIPTRY